MELSDFAFRSFDIFVDCGILLNNFIKKTTLFYQELENANILATSKKYLKTC